MVEVEVVYGIAGYLIISSTSTSKSIKLSLFFVGLSFFSIPYTPAYVVGEVLVADYCPPFAASGGYSSSSTSPIGLF